MNRASILAASLALNITLLILLLISRRSVENQALALNPSTAPAPTATNSPAPGVNPAPIQPTPQPFNWQMVESPDYRAYIANLKAIGCPEETIHDIIVADVRKLMTARYREESVASERMPYWTTEGLRTWWAKQAQRTQALLDEEKRILSSLLGENAPSPPPTPYLSGRFSFLPEEKVDMVMAVEHDFALKISQVKDTSGAGAEATQRLTREKEAAVAALLSPQEFDLYQYKTSMTAHLLRTRMRHFQPTEDEFQKLFALQKDYDDEFNAQGYAGGLGAKEAAQKALEEQIRQTLGPDRYHDYQLARNPGYQAIAEGVNPHSSNRGAAARIWDIKEVAEDQVYRIRRDTSLTMEQRENALKAVRSETERTIQKELGPDGFNSLRKGVGGRWINLLSPE